MENQIFKDINTDLDLNGPYLSFVTQPSQENTCALYSGNHRLIFINNPGSNTPVTFYSCSLKGTEKCLFEYNL